MSIVIQVPSMLRHECGGARELTLTADSVRAVLGQLRLSHPQLYISICDETGAIRQHVNLFVNDAFLHQREGLDTVLQAGDVVSIMPAVSGG